MSRIAFTNISANNQFAESTSLKLVDPVHLVAMENICRNHGHQSGIFPPHEVKKISEFRPDILGFSFVGHTPQNLQTARQIIQAFPLEAKPRLIFGGTDLDRWFELYFEEFSPWIMALGEGEKLVAALAQHSFNLNDTLALEISEDVYRVNETYIFATTPHTPLDQQGFNRHYDFTPYENEAWVKWSTGCFGSCNFCTRPQAPLDYRSAKLAAQEASQLESLGIVKINIASPNFTNFPRRAAEILEAVPETLIYRFTSRVDSLYWSLTRFPETWKNFSRWFNTIELGVESFNPQRLAPERMKKYPNLKQALLQKEKLDYILNFFKGSMSKIDLYLINFDWQMTLAEVELEIRSARDYISNFPDNVLLQADRLDQFLHFSPGSYFSDRMEPVDFLNFKKDPRVFWLLMLFSDQLTALKEYLIRREVGFGIISKQVLAPILLDYLLARIEGLKKIPPADLNLRAALGIYKSNSEIKSTLAACPKEIKFPDLPLKNIYKKVRRALEVYQEEYAKFRQSLIASTQPESAKIQCNPCTPSPGNTDHADKQYFFAAHESNLLL